MSGDDAEEYGPMMNGDREIKELIGLFDLPAFARRGSDLEYALGRIHARCRDQRHDLLEMVRVRLRQWSRAVTGLEAWSAVFRAPIDSLWPMSRAEDPTWATAPAPLRQQQAVAADLIASVSRFNNRWCRFVEGLNLAPANHLIDQYNKYYVIEKECVLGSSRLATRHFTPVTRITPSGLLVDYPRLPAPELLEPAGRRERP